MYLEEPQLKAIKSETGNTPKKIAIIPYIRIKIKRVSNILIQLHADTNPIEVTTNY